MNVVNCGTTVKGIIYMLGVLRKRRENGDRKKYLRK